MRPVPEISAARYRAGQGEPVVLLHGFTATWRCWLPVLAELAARYDVLAPTLSGHDGGPAMAPGQGHSIGDAADHLEAQLEAQGIDTAHLVGNSMGGALALELAKRGRARSVVGLSPGGGWHLGDPEGDRIERLFRRQLRLTEATERWLPGIMRRPSTRRLVLRDVVRHGEQLPPSEAVMMARSSLAVWSWKTSSPPCAQGPGCSRTSTGCAHPRSSRGPSTTASCPSTATSSVFAPRSPDVAFRVLPGVGHVPMSDNPRLVAKTIIDWVQSHRA